MSEPTRDASDQLAELSENQPLSLLLKLRASDSPLHAIHPHPGIMTMAAMIADGGDCSGIEPDDLELLVRTAIYMDRIFRTPKQKRPRHPPK